MPDIRVSAIIPVHNGARFIGEAIDSVRAQTAGECEAVVVDDGSTDDTAAIVRGRALDGSVVYLHQENAGPAAARNTGIRAARGEWIAFLDADDRWEPRKIEHQLAYAADHPGVRAVHCDLAVYRDGRKVEGEIPERKIFEGWVFQDCLLLRCWVFLSCLMVHRTVFDRVGVFDESLGTAEDTNLILRIARNNRFGYVNEVLVRRRLHEANMTVQRGAATGTYKNLAHIAWLYPELDPVRSPLMRTAYVLRYLQQGRTAFRSGDYARARRLLFSALRLDPLRFEALFCLGMMLVPKQRLEALRRVKRMMEHRAPARTEKV